jgi:hypothetical protein
MSTTKQEDAVSSRLRDDAGLTSRGVFLTDLHRGGRAPAGAPEAFTLCRGASRACGVVPAAPAGVSHKALLWSIATALLILGCCS